MSTSESVLPAARPWLDSLLRVRAWHREVAWLVAAFVLLYGALLYKTDGVPYVLDNNESFSALVHGANLYHFDLSRSYGLTDEAYGSDPQAHPYVYTHQGNFPRLFAFLLYAAGIRSIEAQIAITTFTIGLGSILLAYLFFSRLAGRAYGFIVAGLFLSDYMLSVQWIVNTFKVWHSFLLFAVLAALQAYFADGRKRWLFWAGLGAACIAYFDLLLGVFSFSLAGLYALAELRRAAGRKVALAFFALGAGGLFSVAIFLLQLIGYYGIDGLKNDVYLTFMGRNYFANDPAVNEQWRNFFTGHRIVFWEMLVDSSVYTGLGALLKSVFMFGFSIYTPYFGFLVLALSLAKLASMVLVTLMKWTAAARRAPGWVHIGGEFLAWTGANLVLGFIAFTPSLETANSKLPLKILADGPYLLIAFAVITAAVFVPLAHDSRRADARRTFVLAAYFVALSALLLYHPSLYHAIYGDPQPIWEYILRPWTSTGAQKLFAALAVGLGGYWIMRAASVGEARGARSSPHGGVLHFLALSSIAFVAAYYFSPGYMQLINLQRFAPVLVFVLIPLVAWAVLCVHEEARGLVQARAGTSPAEQRRFTSKAAAAVGLLLLIHLTAFWVWLQKSHIEIAPPDGAEAFKLMDKPPFKGASFVVNSYGAPIAAKTGSWAYVDAVFFRNAGYALDDDGYRLDGSDLYKWFNNRDNPKYRVADYALCFHMHPGFSYPLRALAILQKAKPFDARIGDIFNPSDALRGYIKAGEKKGFEGFGCALEPLVGHALKGHVDELKLSVVARDRSLVDRWAIVKLESDFPPYLRRLEAGLGTEVRVTVRRSSGRCIATPTYLYAQQQGKKEDGTLMEAWVHNNATGARRAIYLGAPLKAIPIPQGTTGTLVVTVTPRTASRTGRTFASPQVGLQDC